MCIFQTTSEKYTAKKVWRKKKARSSNKDMEFVVPLI